MFVIYKQKSLSSGYGFKTQKIFRLAYGFFFFEISTSGHTRRTSFVQRSGGVLHEVQQQDPDGGTRAGRHQRRQGGLT
jgi:hypothetical protein